VRRFIGKEIHRNKVYPRSDPRDAVNATQISNPNEAYLIANNPHLSIYWNKFRPDILLSCMRHFAMFLFFAILFFHWKTEARQKSGFLFDFCTIILVRIVVIKESQGGFESTLGLLSTGQWLSIPFIYRTVFSQLKTSKNLDLVLK
jgi:hypothetical protein